MAGSGGIAIIAEECDFHRGGLAALLQLKFNFGKVIQVRSRAKLMDALEKNPQPDLLAVDVDLLDPLAADFIRDWRLRVAKLRIVAFATAPSRKNLLKLLAAGANGIIPSDAVSTELSRAIEIVQSGGNYVPSAMWQEEPARLAMSPCDLTGLTDRQRQVLSLLSEGCANKIIARKLGISPSTVKVHVHALFRLLGVHSRVEAVAALRPVPQRRPREYAGLEQHA